MKTIRITITTDITVNWATSRENMSLGALIVITTTFQTVISVARGDDCY